MSKPKTGAWHPSNRVWIGCLIAIGAWTGILSAGLWFYIDPPMRVHDEFSYRLAADTLMHGRLSNPTPPAWQSLQSFHTVMQPSYASKYPLGFAIVVAIGLAIFGIPHAGSWLCAAMLVTSCTWMLASVLSRRWALLGGLILSLHPFMQISWAESLMNGLLPATGSALLTGAILRLRRRTTIYHAAIAGIGIAILALTRPFEGLCCTVLCGLLLFLLSKESTWRARWTQAIRIAAPACLPVVIAIALTIAQNISVTAGWTQMAYQLHEQQYGVAPLFVFRSPRMENAQPRAGLPKIITKYHAVECLNWYRERTGIQGWVRGINDGIAALGMLSFPAATLLLIAGRQWLRLRLPMVIMAMGLMQLTASATVCWVYPHYLAPIFPWIFLVVMIAVRVSHFSRTTALRTIRTLAIVALLALQVISIVTVSRVAKARLDESWAKNRQRIERSLDARGGKHLILVDYTEDHNVHHEWVYNAADPSSSSIVWARNENGLWTKEVMCSYGVGRDLWRLNADSKSPKLERLTSLRDAACTSTDKSD